MDLVGSSGWVEKKKLQCWAALSEIQQAASTLLSVSEVNTPEV